MLKKRSLVEIVDEIIQSKKTRNDYHCGIRYLQHFPKEFWDKELILKILPISRDIIKYEDLSNDMKNDRDIFKCAIENKHEIEEIPSNLIVDDEIVEFAIKVAKYSYRLFVRLPEHIKTQKHIILLKISHGGIVYRDLPTHLKNDIEVLDKIIEMHINEQYLTSLFKDQDVNDETIYFVLKKCGMSRHKIIGRLLNLIDVERRDKILEKVAISDYSCALFYSNELITYSKTDEYSLNLNLNLRKWEIVHNPVIMDMIDDNHPHYMMIQNMKRNEEHCLYMVKKNRIVYFYLPQESKFFKSVYLDVHEMTHLKEFSNVFSDVLLILTS